jgi:hypothetical protein
VQHYLKKGILPPGLPPGMALGIIAPPPLQPFSSSSSQSRPSGSLTKPAPYSPSSARHAGPSSGLLVSPQKKPLPPSTSNITPLILTPPNSSMSINHSAPSRGSSQPTFSPVLPSNRSDLSLLADKGKGEKESQGGGGGGGAERKNFSHSPPVSRPTRQVVRPPRSVTPTSTRPGGVGDVDGDGRELRMEREGFGRPAPAALSAMKGSKQFYSMNQMSLPADGSQLLTFVSHLVPNFSFL